MKNKLTIEVSETGLVSRDKNRIVIQSQLLRSLHSYSGIFHMEEQQGKWVLESQRNAKWSQRTVYCHAPPKRILSIGLIFQRRNWNVGV